MNAFGPLPPNTRHDNPVQEFADPATATNKINYVVPANMNLFIEQWHVSVSEGNKNVFELQDDGTALASIGNGESGGNTAPMLLPQFNPIGPIAAGSTVRISRTEGDSGKDWAGGFMGYLENE